MLIHAEKIHDEISELRRTLKDLYYKRENQSDIILENQNISDELFRQKIETLEQYLYDHLDTNLEKWKKLWQEYKNKNIGNKELIKQSLILAGPKFINLILKILFSKLK